MLREADDAKASLYGTINFHVTRNNYLAAKPLAAFNNTREQPICEANHCFFMYEWDRHLSTILFERMRDWDGLFVCEL